MAGRRTIYFLTLVGCVIFYGAYQQWVSWFALLAVLLLPLFSLVVSLPAMLLARLQIDNPRAIYLGQRQELVLLYGSRFLPTPPWRCRIQIQHPMTDRQWRVKDVEDLPADHCGELIFKIRKARVYDYLGLISIPMRRGGESRTLVRPCPVHPGPVPDPDQHRSTVWRPKRGGGFAENHELRLYRPGDSIQQIHWKLSAKTGQLILREPMEPIRGRVLLRLDLSGNPAELDEKLGKLCWIGDMLLGKNLIFTLQCLTGSGVESWQVTDHAQLQQAVDDLLRRPKAQFGTLRDHPEQAAWQYYIGGDADVT